MTDELKRLRAQAISNTFFRPTTLPKALLKMGFVQADPIRSPATAQDLILRHRVKDYRAGDLERRYSSLDIEEDYLYAYGFMPRENWQLLHPRNFDALTKLEKQILKVVQSRDEVHPRELEAEFGNERVINAWGGHSKETTTILDNLHHRGLLRVARREKGIRVYSAIAGSDHNYSPSERARKLLLLLVGIFDPILEKNLRKLRFSKPPDCNVKAILDELIKRGELTRNVVDGLAYLSLSTKNGNSVMAENKVRFLAPFDPLVWDREKFHLMWNWHYRFEAYTPVAKRVRGYYALPLLWQDDVVGWVNVIKKDSSLDFDFGFVDKQPKSKEFKAELEAEVERFKLFLKR